MSYTVIWLKFSRSSCGDDDNDDVDDDDDDEEGTVDDDGYDTFEAGLSQ